MAIAQNPITGQMRKSYGNVNTYSRNGQNVISAKPFARKDANSEAQQKHRAGFKLTVEAYSSFGGYIETGYPVRPARLSVFNAFMAENFPAAIDNTGETPVVDYRKLKVSRGTLTSMDVLSATVDNTGIVVTFDSKVDFPKASTDDVAILLVKTVSGRLYAARDMRGAEEEMTLTVLVAGITKEDIVCTYLIMTTANGKKASDSVFVELG